MTQADLFASPDAEPFIRSARIENPKSSHDAAAEIEETAESRGTISGQRNPANRHHHPMTPRSDKPQQPANMDRSKGRSAV